MITRESDINDNIPGTKQVINLFRNTNDVSNNLREGEGERHEWKETVPHMDEEDSDKSPDRKK